MLSFWQKLVIALIQAILEWLPVSSEGFMILTAVNLFGETAEEAFRYAIYFHLGTAISVGVKYWRTYWDALVKDRGMLRFIIVSTAATGIIGVPLYILLGDLFQNFTGLMVTLFIGVTLLVTGTLLRFGKLKAADTREMEDRKIWEEITLGACQGFAILPGISRSGTTTAFLLLRGFKKEDALKMSFIISLPAVCGAIAFDLLFEGTTIGFGWDYLLLMAIVAVVGYGTMNLLLRMAHKLPFDVICYILGGITIVLCVLLLAL